MKKIEKPGWEHIKDDGTYVPDAEYEGIGLHEREKFALDEWFNRYVEPINEILEDAVEVYSAENITHFQTWFTEKTREPKLDTHKALLINIEPIKKESAEDVLRDMISAEVMNWDATDQRGELLERAKKILGED